MWQNGTLSSERFEEVTSDEHVRLVYIGKVEYGLGWAVEPHVHAYYEVSCFAEGACEYTIDGQTYHMRPGDVLVTKPGELHAILVTDDVRGTLFYVGVDVTGPPEVELAFRLSNLKRITGLTDLMPHASRIVEELRAPQLGTKHLVQSLLNQMLVEIARRLGGGNGFSRDRFAYSECVEKARFYIESNARHGLPVDEISRAAGVSASRLAHLFSAQMCTSVGRYANHVLMQRASRLLEESAMNVSEIAEALGFPSIHYFSSAFKKYRGVSPAHYRRDSLYVSHTLPE